MASLIDLFKNSEFADQIKDESPSTFIEQETNGIRVESGVDLNNPTFYGNEAVRIGTRTTRTKDTMLQGTNPTGGQGGILNEGIQILSGGKLKTISDARNKINDAIGIPDLLIPTRMADKLETGLSVQDVLDQKKWY